MFLALFVSSAKCRRCVKFRHITAENYTKLFVDNGEKDGFGLTKKHIRGKIRAKYILYILTYASASRDSLLN